MTVVRTIAFLYFILVVFTVDLIIGRKLAKKEYFSLLNLEEDLFDSENEPQLQAIGCYRDETNDRALPDYYENFSGNTITEIKSGCANAAVAKGYAYFGIQYGGECWGPGDGDLQYDKHGSADNCENNIGGSFSNYVYKIESVKGYCVYNSKLLKYNTTVIENDPCDCRCMEDGKVVCHHKTCPGFPMMCEKKVTPTGQCCPVCACYHNSTSYNDGDHWVWPLKDKGCEECTCINNQAVCEIKECCGDCATKQPTIIILPTTEEPVLTFPPFWP